MVEPRCEPFDDLLKEPSWNNHAYLQLYTVNCHGELRSLSRTPCSSWALRCFLWLCLCCASLRFQSKCGRP